MEVYFPLRFQVSRGAVQGSYSGLGISESGFLPVILYCIDLLPKVTSCPPWLWELHPLHSILASIKEEEN
jgi:hypothetical protein